MSSWSGLNDDLAGSILALEALDSDSKMVAAGFPNGWFGAAAERLDAALSAIVGSCGPTRSDLAEISDIFSSAEKGKLPVCLAACPGPAELIASEDLEMKSSMDVSEGPNT